ncbi:MAG: hypothetical protein ACK4UK_01010 [Flavobacterium sp.]
MKVVSTLFILICFNLQAQEAKSHLKTLHADLNQNGFEDTMFLTYDISPSGATMEIEIIFQEQGSEKSITSSKIEFPSQSKEIDDFQLFNFSYEEGYLAVIYAFKGKTHFLYFTHTVNDFDLVYYSELNRSIEPHTSQTLNLREGILYSRRIAEGEIISENSRIYYVEEIPTLSNFSGFSLKKTL